MVIRKESLMNNIDVPILKEKLDIGLTSRFDNSIEYKNLDLYRNPIYCISKNTINTDDIIEYSFYSNIMVFNNKIDDNKHSGLDMKCNKSDTNIFRIYRTLQNINNDSYELQSLNLYKRYL